MVCDRKPVKYRIESAIILIIIMPELPEVETIKNALLPLLKGGKITETELLCEKSVHKPDPKQFCQKLAGQNIKDIRRRGKYFLFDLSDGEVFILHLKMTGVLLLESKAEPQKHSVAIFKLDGRPDLHFIDQRKFGSLWLVKDENEVVGKLGPEPLGKEFTADVLKEIASRHKIPIKALLFDQRAIAGVGNMYADEALFAARIHPLKPAINLTTREIQKLRSGIIEVLEKGISHNGASVSDYRLPDGAQGMAQTQFQVAHRKGETCLICGYPITRIKVRGRGTYFCPVCQPEYP